MPTTPQRPPQVTLAAWLIIVGSVAVVVASFVEVASLRTVETREAISDYLSSSPGESLGLGVDSAVRAIRVLTFVAAGCATAAAFLGREVLQRSRSARLVLSVLAAPLFLAGLTTGGVLSAAVAAAIAMLWLQPARDWFDGVTRPAKQPTVAARPSTPRGPSAAPDAWSPSSAWPPQFAPPGPPRRPQAVKSAAVVTWVCCGLMVLTVLVAGVLIGLNSDSVIASLRDQQASLNSTDVPDGMLMIAIYFWLVVFGLWASAAIVVATFLWRGAGWARPTLRWSAGVAGTGLFVLTLGNPLFAPLFAGCLACVVLLARPDVHDWVGRR